MEIKGKVHCFFEQSGTFKNEFIKLGIPAEDYDIQDNFGQTDHYDDLFQAIDDAFNGKPSLFDNISRDDLIMAFFPCIYFCENNQLAFTGQHRNYRKLTEREKAEKIIERSHNREVFYRYLTMLYAVVAERGLRMIIENPWSTAGYLNNNFIIPKVRGIMGLWQFSTKGSASSIPQVRDTFDAVLESNGHCSGVVFDLSVKMHTSQKPNTASKYPVVTLMPNESEEVLRMVKECKKPLMIE